VRRGRFRGGLCGGLAIAAAALTACGGTPKDAVVVRVGDVAIAKGTVDHWTSVIERKGAFTGFRGQPQGSARRRALALLISSHWLIGEAARERVLPPESALDEAVEAREQEAPGFARRLRATGETVPDVKLEMRAELAGETIREQLADRASRVSRRDVLDFYRANAAQFRAPEVRVVDLLENLPSASAATALVRKIGTGARFAKLAYREHVTRSPGIMATHEKALVVEAIFAARPGAVSRPVQLNHHWAVFVVRRIVPPRPQRLASVRGEVLKRLNVTRQRAIATSFDREFLARWRAKTSCRSGYVAPGCPQAHEPLGRYEDPFSLRAHPLLSEQAAADADQTGTTD
jgi:foldase protein PrsA